MNGKQLREAIALLRKQISDLEFFLLEKYDNPYAMIVRKDLAAKRVTLQTKEYNLENYCAGRPSHGEEMPEESKPNDNRKIGSGA